MNESSCAVYEKAQEPPDNEYYGNDVQYASHSTRFLCKMVYC